MRPSYDLYYCTCNFNYYVLKSSYAVKHGLDLNAAVALSKSLDGNLMIYMLPLIVFIFHTDFKQKTLKNSITTGLTRNRIFLVKVAVFVCFLYLEIVLNYLFYFVSGLIVGGLGIFKANWFLTLLYQLLMQGPMYLAVAAIVLLIFEVTKSSSFSISTGIILPMAINLWSAAKPSYTFIKFFDFMQGLTSITKSNFAHIGQLSHVITGAAIIIFGLGFIGDYLFNHLDI